MADQNGKTGQAGESSRSPGDELTDKQKWLKKLGDAGREYHLQLRRLQGKARRAQNALEQAEVSGSATTELVERYHTAVNNLEDFKARNKSYAEFRADAAAGRGDRSDAHPGEEDPAPMDFTSEPQTAHTSIGSTSGQGPSASSGDAVDRFRVVRASTGEETSIHPIQDSPR
ncbi:hypothetical protein B0O99DRAFT_593955 [Bisporella sp. PMI_857]|nr:hypothetical protein B0O99DRAFT_593955 [Bisporella sp. PMI_857]